MAIEQKILRQSLDMIHSCIGLKHHTIIHIGQAISENLTSFRHPLEAHTFATVITAALGDCLLWLLCSIVVCLLAVLLVLINFVWSFPLFTSQHVTWSAIPPANPSAHLLHGIMHVVIHSFCNSTKQLRY